MGVVEDLGHAAWAQQVHLDGGIERGFKAHRRGRVDHRLAAIQHLTAGLVKAEAVNADITCDRTEAPSHLVVEPITELPSKPVEAVVAKNLPADALVHTPSAGSDDRDDLAIRDGAKQPFNQGGPEKARRARHGDALTSQDLSDHPQLSTIW